MHRLIVAFLAAVDAALAVAVGVAATLAPLTLLWVFGFGGTADWATLWPAAVALWQLGNLVPLAVTLPPEYLAASGIDAAAASFTVSLAPLAFAAFTVVFAARSGVRASRAQAWGTGAAVGSAIFAGLATGAALTSANPIAVVEPWRAILTPTLLFAVPALIAALVTEWREADEGRIARVRDRIEAAPHGWGSVPALVARGAAVVVAGLVGLGAALTAVAVFARAGQIVALFQAGNADGLGASVLTLGQLAYLPTLAVWGLAFAAGPGFALGAGTAVSPAATEVGIVPGVPVLGAIPESSSSWLLLLALVPVGLGALAGWMARSRASRDGEPRMPRARDARTPAPSRIDAARTSALDGLLSASAARGRDRIEDAGFDIRRGQEQAIGPRVVTAVGIALGAAAVAALLAAAASGSVGPGRLTDVGPHPGPVALAVGLEVLLGASIVLLSPGRRGARTAAAPATAAAAAAPGTTARSEDRGFVGGSAANAPTWARFSDGDDDERADAARPDRADAPGADAPTDEGPGEPASEARTEPIDLPRLD
jgi:hypothetical protein